MCVCVCVCVYNINIIYRIIVKHFLFIILIWHIYNIINTTLGILKKIFPNFWKTSSSSSKLLLLILIKFFSLTKWEMYFNICSQDFAEHCNLVLGMT